MSGRTPRPGPRRKILSLWIASIGIGLVGWAALALLSPLLHAAYPLSEPPLSWSRAWSAMAADTIRAPFVIAVFVLVGVAASVVVRNALGSFALSGGLLVASLAAAGNWAPASRWTLGYWVSGWMRFRSHGSVIYHFWVDGFPSRVPPPSILAGTLGLVATATITIAAAAYLLARTDITAEHHKRGTEVMP